MQYRSVSAKDVTPDVQAVASGTYRYAIKVFTHTSESPLSEAVSLEIPAEKR